MTTTVRTWLDFALLQSAAETYLENIDLGNKAFIREHLRIGNNDPIKLELPAHSPLLPGATRFTDTQRVKEGQRGQCRIDF